MLDVATAADDDGIVLAARALAAVIVALVEQPDAEIAELIGEIVALRSENAALRARDAEIVALRAMLDDVERRLAASETAEGNALDGRPPRPPVLH